MTTLTRLLTMLQRFSVQVFVVAAVALFPVAVNAGEALTPTSAGVYQPGWNPLELGIRLAKGTVVWPDAATWLGTVFLLALVGGLVALSFATPGGSAASAVSGNGVAGRLATGQQLAPLMGKAMRKDATNLHPHAQGIAPGQVLGVPAAGRAAVLYQGWRDLGVCIMGPGTGKTSCCVVPRILNAPGSALMTGNKVDGVAQVIAGRHHLGPVWVWDLGKIFRQPDTPDFIFNPLAQVRGTEDAMRLASWLITASAKNNPRTETEAKDDAHFGPAGESCLAWMLLAAAKTGKTLAHVHDWASKGALLLVSNLLDDLGYTRPAAEVAGYDKWPDKTRGSLVATVQRMCRDLVHEAILPWTTPTPGIREFDPAGFLQGRQTLIMLSERGPGSAGAIITALVNAITRTAIRETPGEARLKVPLVGELDEIANIAAWPSLPKDFSYFGSRGLCFTVYLQAYSQGVSEWGENGMKTLWQTAGIRLLGASEEDTFTQGISQRLGTWEKPTGEGKPAKTMPKASVEDLSNIPKFTALLSTSITPAAIIKLRRWDNTPAMKRTVEHGLPAARAIINGTNPTAIPIPVNTPVVHTKEQEKENAA
ncbi:type IV secretory system conjugative DNA transfer family protein [Arthrobacter sp. NyZ413]|uniref:type IV secretory system conjugative DNA transfer family protein n=1 Tax=Arthrobacter sp. NyZ413 TaxID=3144669 RepID=UPI003BF7B5B3